LTMNSASRVGELQVNIEKYAGSRAASIDVVLSEYGLQGAMPSYAPHFLRSLGMGIMQGLFLQQWISRHIAMAGRHALINSTYGPTPPEFSRLGLPDQAIIEGPGPETISSPSALAIKLVAEYTRPVLVQSNVMNNPSRTLSSGQVLPSLSTT